MTQIGTKRKAATKRTKKPKEWLPFSKDLIKVRVNNLATQKIMVEEDVDDNGDSIDLD